MSFLRSSRSNIKTVTEPCKSDPNTPLWAKKLMDRFEELEDTITDLSDKFEELTTKIDKALQASEKPAIELVNMKAQVREQSQFMQGLVLELIKAPKIVQPALPPPIPEKANGTLAAYIAKKNGEVAKPRLP